MQGLSTSGSLGMGVGSVVGDIPNVSIRLGESLYPLTVMTVTTEQLAVWACKRVWSLLRRSSLALLGIEPRFLEQLARSPVAVRTSLALVFVSKSGYTTKYFCLPSL